jgi:hypothetical protein
VITNHFAENLALKQMMDGPLSHIKAPAHIKLEDFKGDAKYQSMASIEEMFPEIVMIEDLMQGFVKGASSLASNA